MIRAVVLAVALLVLGVSSLHAQTASDAQQRIERAKERATATGIPVSLLESKVAEGMAKGVPMERIAGAVESRLAALTRARTVMSLGEREWSPADLSVGADALQEGVSEQALRSVSRAAPPDQRAVAIAVLTHLVQQGDDPNQALARVQAALQRGPEALRNLPAEAAAERERRGRGEGRPPNGGNGAMKHENRLVGQGGPPAAVPAPGKKQGSEKPKEKNRPEKPGKPPKPHKP
ncbi:MAG: hypothetical protein M3418_12735 [Gemmatimonadota bacterium]|jgi:hypothetical protein|nr:hypothetical protein [Gemmatimonadota bacterium]